MIAKKLKKNSQNVVYQITLDEAEMIWDEYCQLIYFASRLPVEINHHAVEEIMKLDVAKKYFINNFTAREYCNINAYSLGKEKKGEIVNTRVKWRIVCPLCNRPAALHQMSRII
ncbi:hypothetical protein [Paenibacillus typhae]|uniref:hypothetical protein n=1 Tax=Paenibacillus typhae TaxID=1174501 RepID=UPI001C8CF6CB|nr:hypothetical protein [Paenibacillus typhae]MBY0012067.1 hypothetical protein [Paenibacillus typhae]